MSYCLTVYAVSVEHLQRVLGSRDEKLIQRIAEENDYFFSRIDEIDDEAGLSCADALTQMIRGEVSDDAPGYLYGYALKAICAAVGSELPAIYDIVGTGDWSDEVDQALKQAGAPVRLTQLMYGGSPVPIPEPDDFPSIGNWSPAQVQAASAALKIADLAGDTEMAHTLRQIQGWSDIACNQPQTSLIGFLS